MMEYSSRLKVTKGYSYCGERAMTKLVGYRIKNISNIDISINKPVYVRDTNNRLIVSKDSHTKVILQPGDELDLTAKDLVVIACDPNIYFKFYNGILAKKPGASLMHTKDIVGEYYFKGTMELEEITEKINGVTVIKEEFKDIFERVYM